ADASYQAYESAPVFMRVPICRPDKAFTPHPAIGAQRLMRR
ncbi:hypothetical protein HMPREF1596_04848, partial [Escherichia coli 907700]